MLAIEAASVKNKPVHHGGFTPSRWVLGRLSIETDALTNNFDADHYLGVHQQIEDGASALPGSSKISNAARQAFAQRAGEAGPPGMERSFYAFLARRVCKKSVARPACPGATVWLGQAIVHRLLQSLASSSILLL